MELKETLLEWVNILRDEITDVLWYCDKNSGILPSRFFFTRVMKMMSFPILIICGKGVFHNLNLKMMKINNEVNFLNHIS